jgi:hypothetical protein
VQGTDPSQQSPWELFDAGAGGAGARAEAPSLDAGVAARAAAALQAALRCRAYRLFHTPPGPDAVFTTGSDGDASPTSPITIAC